MSLTAVLRRMKRGDIAVHGFRSTFRDWCAESSNFPRGDLLEKRSQLMKAWADYCAKPPEAASVTPIGSKRKAGKPAAG